MKQLIGIIRAEIIKQHQNSFQSRYTYFSLLIWPVISFFNGYYAYKPFSLHESIWPLLSSPQSVILFLIIGYLGYECFWTLVSSAWQMSLERQDGTLEIIFLSPVNKLALIYGRVLGALIQNIWMFFLFSVLMICFVRGFPIFNLVYLPICVLVVLVAATAWGGLMNAIFLFSRDATIVFSLFNEPMHLLAGVRVPVSVFPWGIKVLSVLLPLTHSLHIMRKLLMEGDLLSSIPSIIYLFFTVIVMIILTVVIIHFAEKNARKNGSYNFY
ncbi:ABC transporter permease [Paenibacillus massiliensis]|uniref:ABC transporter permease n=1 Tax=Paenibacillus massiliensis TaxID=225917 RepID=UPI00041172ED|nr:ABC transporter permease [Paenibacillus massiliensis]